MKNQYLENQAARQSKQKKAILLLLLGSAIGLIFLPAVLIAIYGVGYYWWNTWKIHTAKCPSCGKNVGIVQQWSNEKCRNCGLIFLKPIVGEAGENQDKWLE